MVRPERTYRRFFRNCQFTVQDTLKFWWSQYCPEAQRLYVLKKEFWAGQRCRSSRPSLMTTPSTFYAGRDSSISSPCWASTSIGPQKQKLIGWYFPHLRKTWAKWSTTRYRWEDSWVILVKLANLFLININFLKNIKQLVAKLTYKF